MSEPKIPETREQASIPEAHAGQGMGSLRHGDDKKGGFHYPILGGDFQSHESDWNQASDGVLGKHVHLFDEVISEGSDRPDEEGERRQIYQSLL